MTSIPITHPLAGWNLILSDLRPRLPQETVLLETMVGLSALVQDAVAEWDEVTVPVPAYLAPHIPALIAHGRWVDPAYWADNAKKIHRDRTHDAYYWQRKKEGSSDGNQPIAA